MSLRTRILLLVLLATLTPAVLFGYFAYKHRDTEIAQAKQSLIALAAYATRDLNDKVSGTVQLLHGLSRAPVLDEAGKTRCSAFLGDVLKRYPQYTGVLTIRPDGQLHCDSLASGRTLDLNDRAYFKAARASSEPAYEAVFGRLTGIAVLQIAYPALDSDGELKYVLLASLNLAQFGARFGAAGPHPDMEVVIWDAQGTILARSPDAGSKKLSGSVQPDSPLYRFAHSGKDGDAAELPGPDGTLKVWARSALPAAASGGLSLALGVPRDLLLAQADKDLSRGLLILGVVSLFAFMTAVLFAELGIRRQLARIMAAARHQGAGDPGARIGPPYPRGELGQLMEKLDATAYSVQMQQAEIESKSAELGRNNRTLRVLGAINSAIVRVHDKSELLAEACRIAVRDGSMPIAWAGLVEQGTQQVKPVAWQGVDEAYVRSVQRLEEAGGSVIASVIQSSRPLVIDDLAADTRPVQRDAAMALGSRSLAVLPLAVSGEVIGILVLHSREPGFFDAQEMKLLEELAGDLALALESIEKSERLDYLAYYDPLTGLANRALFHDRLSQYLGMVGGHGRKVALILADVERFRTINDTLGRAAGDDLLRQIATRASGVIADKRWLARTGADHFASIIPDVSGREAVTARLEQVHREVFDKPFLVGASELWVSARFGIALSPADGADADSLFRHADIALAKAKARNERYVFYKPRMSERVSEKLTLENKLRLALDNEEFVLHYQPKVGLAHRRVAGVEALIRWQSPEQGLMSPLEFLPLLEETGLIRQVGAWTLARAARDWRGWRDAGYDPPRIAINVSPAQVRHRDFVRELSLAIGEGGAQAGIDLEITEGLLMEDMEGNIRKLHEIHSLGLNIAIDHFGTGYTSLAHLAKLPIQALKIDRAFVVAMLQNPDTMAMVSTIISLAHSLRLGVIAVGVDAEDQAKLLHLLRCDQMQGYLFSRPIPARTFEEKFLAAQLHEVTA